MKYLILPLLLTACVSAPPKAVIIFHAQTQGTATFIKVGKADINKLGVLPSDTCYLIRAKDWKFKK